LVVVLSSALLGAAPLFAAAPAAKPSAKAKVEYNRDVRPILSDTCFLCHGPDKNTRKAKLRLDLRDEAIAREAFVPGKPDESELVKRILTTDEDDMMPPPDSHKHLTVEQKETLRRWIAEGAEYQPHWAYVIPTRPEAPAVKNRKWVRNAIDSFVIQNLEAKNLKPSREADRRTLLRRLSLDLIGLPPTPEEIAAFVADKDPRAYEKQVERLLASPHFGERMAVPWLDTARFSDTVGYHGDQNQRIFPYRDYVIASFNQNKPFDKFTIEQLAGDLLPNPTVEQRVATGFNRLNMMTREGGAQPKEYLAKHAADRVRTVGTTWLGSTMGCAECHDHKFDPITSRDFYSMAAFFADVKQWGVYNDYKYTPNPDLKGWSNDHPFPPEIEVQSEYLKRRAEHFRGLIREHFAALAIQNRTNAVFKDWALASRELLAKLPDGWGQLEVVIPVPPAPTVTFTTNVTATATNIIAKTNQPAPPTITLADGGAVRVALSKKKEEEKIELRPAPGRLAALRLEHLAGDSDEDLDPGAQARGIRLSAALKRKGKETKVSFYRADASHKEPRYANGEELIGVLTGWKPSGRHGNETQTAIWLPEPPLEVKPGDTLVVTLKGAVPLKVRFAASPFAAEDPLQAGAGAEFRAALAIAPATWSNAQRALLAERYLLSTQSDEEAFAKFKKLQADLLECRNGRTHTMVTEAQSPYTMRVLPRGNWQNESGDIVQPAPPHFLPQPKGASRRLTRLDLARWLVSRDNPLTARVFMNRLWKEFFGTGISVVVDDLGSQGEWPVNPALLDWLAVEFMEPSVVGAEVTRLKSSAGAVVAKDQSLLASAPAHAWDIKHMVRLIVTSAAYRQDSNLRPELRDLDPLNRWLASQNPRRLDAEFVRDNALFAAGLLNLDLGGPSARPYQPANYYANLQFPDRDYVAHDDDRQYRRGVYMHWQRTFLHPMLANFDAPGREECTANRPASNTPQQALTLLNDPTFVETARVFAANLLSTTRASDNGRIEAAYQKALGRAPKAKEASSLARFLGEQRAYYKATPDDAKKLLEVGRSPAPATIEQAELAAWTQVCRVVLNLHESVTRY
jgi:hypothetical protein